MERPRLQGRGGGLVQPEVTEGHGVESGRGSSCSACYMALVLWRPDPDCCSGIKAQSVFIRERAKIIQEGSGPLIHLKQRMKGGSEPREAGGSWGLF